MGSSHHPSSGELCAEDIEKPIDYGLPASDEKYIFAKNDQYFIYQNNFNKFALHYKNTFQHGGISMEEMIIPIIILNPK